MEEKNPARQIRYKSLRRTDLIESALRPMLLRRDKSGHKPWTLDDQRLHDRKGEEVEVFDAYLNYGDIRAFKGFVFKRFREESSDSFDAGMTTESRLNDALTQWHKIRIIGRELRKKGLPGFNVPNAIRGVIGEESGI